jgi:peptidoglycan/LPS O-acetylase OafA/YrhL
MRSTKCWFDHAPRAPVRAIVSGICWLVGGVKVWRAKGVATMKLAESPTRFGEHENAFGFLRLLFASLVIASHIPEVVDGDSHREILHRLTGNMTLGSFAVWGFFVISGYLITGSMLNTGSVRSYLVRRIARIYPAFIAVSLVCLLVVMPLSGGDWLGGFNRGLITGITRMALLARPVADHPFAGQNYSDYASGLNGALWTIQYEFACYILVLLLFGLGLFSRRLLIPALSVALITVATFADHMLPSWFSRSYLFPASPSQLLILPGIFLAGATFYLFRSSIQFTRVKTFLSLLGLMVCICSPYTAPYGYAVFGSYLIFAAAKAGAGTWVGEINNRNDISYGVYLYAWPAEQLLIKYMGSASLIALGLLTWLIASVAGWLSWKLVERPVLELIRSRRQT